MKIGVIIISTLTIVLASSYLLKAKSLASGMGVSPATLENNYVKPGSTHSQEIIITQSSPDEPLDVLLEPDMGNANAWISFEPGTNFQIEQGVQKYIFKMNFTVPADAQLQNYNGFLRIKTSSSSDAVAGGVSVIQGARLDLNFRVTNEEYSELLVRALSIADVEADQPIQLKLKVENKGNYPNSPSRATLDVMNLNEVLLESLESSGMQNVNPGSTEEIFADFASNLGTGEYFGITKVYLGDSLLREEKLVFRILERPDVSATEEIEREETILDKLSTGNLLATLITVLLVTTASFFAVAMYIKKTKKDETAAEKRRLFIIFFIVALLTSAIMTAIINYDQLFPKEAEVKGVSVERIAPRELYNVYAQPDLNSSQIYEAIESETFPVIQENEEWYQVSLPNGQLGWIGKLSVKELEQTDE